MTSLAKLQYRYSSLYRRTLIVGIVVLILGAVAYAQQRPDTTDAYASVSPKFKSSAARPVLPEGRLTASGSGEADPAPGTIAPEVLAAVAPFDVQAYARMRSAELFGDAHWPALQKLWQRESNWNPNARNPSSGACGIPQALPCSKIPDMSPRGQVEWGLSYIKARYGTPSRAWSFWANRRYY